jgi:hypothetical protein
MAWEFAEVFDELEIGEINEMLARNVPLESLDFFAKYADGHRWYFYPDMTRDEALLIKQWDSAGRMARTKGVRSGLYCSAVMILSNGAVVTMCSRGPLGPRDWIGHSG